MKRRAFLQALAASTYSLASPALLALGANKEHSLAFRLHEFELLPATYDRPQVLTGKATLIERPRLQCVWSHLVDEEVSTVDEALALVRKDMVSGVTSYFKILMRERGLL